MGSEVIPPNEQLLTARTSQSWTCEQVAAALNLPLHTIRYLEDAQYDKLHGEAFVTGYMRAYAELFGFSTEQTEALIKQYLESSRTTASAEAYREPDMFNAKLTGWFQHKQYKTGYGLAAALAVVSFMGVTSLLDTGENVLSSASLNEDIHVQTAAGTTVISSLQQLPQEEPTKDLLPEVAVQKSIAPQAVEEILKQRRQGNLAADEGVPELSSNLSFQFSADCWVEILDGDDKVIYSSLQKAQQRLELSGKPPFRVTLGYAPGVELSYNGRPVALNADNADLVKLVLGNS